MNANTHFNDRETGQPVAPININAKVEAQLRKARLARLRKPGETGSRRYPFKTHSKEAMERAAKDFAPFETYCFESPDGKVFRVHADGTVIFLYCRTV